MNWLRDCWQELRRLRDLVFDPIRRLFATSEKADRLALFAGLSSLALSLIITFILASRTRLPEVEPVPVPKVRRVTYANTVFKPVREIPKRFRANDRKPTQREKDASGVLGDAPFSPEFDLVRMEDKRVWWESDHDTNDTEDDHLFHRAMEEPFRRLVYLVTEKGATLKVQDVYRAEGVHHKNSLHKEGRGIDLTAKDMSLSQLAKLTWASGFDWVFYESPKGGGAHIHASVRAEPLRE